MKPDVKAFFDEDTFTVTYVVTDPSSKSCAIIDPVLDFDQASGRTSTGSADQVLAFIKSGNLKLRVHGIDNQHFHVSGGQGVDQIFDFDADVLMR